MTAAAETLPAAHVRTSPLTFVRRHVLTVYAALCFAYLMLPVAVVITFRREIEFIIFPLLLKSVRAHSNADLSAPLAWTMAPRAAGVSAIALSMTKSWIVPR